MAVVKLFSIRKSQNEFVDCRQAGSNPDRDMR